MFSKWWEGGGRFLMEVLSRRKVGGTEGNRRHASRYNRCPGGLSNRAYRLLKLVRNVMAHAQKPEFVFPRNGWVHLNRWGRQFSRLLAVEECGSVVIMVVMLDRPRSEIKWNCTGYPLHSPVSPSLPLPCVTVCHQVPHELYHYTASVLRSVEAVLRKFCHRH